MSDLRKIINERKKSKSLLSLLVTQPSLSSETPAAKVKSKKLVAFDSIENSSNDDLLGEWLNFKFDSNEILASLMDAYWNSSASSIKPE